MEISSSLVLITIFTLLILVRWWRNVTGSSLPPGPMPVPLIGNLLTLNKRAPFKSFMEWSKSYGPVMTVYLGPQRTVVLVGHEALKEALLDQAEDFAGRAPIPFVYKIVKGYGLIISNGERWRQLRRFTLTTLRDFGMGRKRMEAWIQEESRFLLNAFEETNSAPVDPTFFISRSVSNVICSLVFGQRFDYEDKNFLSLLQILSKILRLASSPWGQMYNIFPRLMELLPVKHHDMFREIDKIIAFIKEKIQEHEEHLNSSDPKDYIDCFLMRLRQEKDNPNTEFHNNNLTASTMNLFLAGTETTSTTIRFSLMILIKYPHIQEQMQKEIDKVIGQDRVPTMEDRKSLPFTDAVIHEVQRFLDLVPLNVPHYALKDITFRGYVIPKDTVILPMLHSVLKSEKQWETPWTFNPNHFLDPSGNFKSSPAFMPFSAGKRSCVGESLARMEIFLFLVSLLQKFSFSCPGGPDAVDPTPELSSFGNIPRIYQLVVSPRQV